MVYVCLRCGAEVTSESLRSQRMKCVKCKERGSNIWIKKRPPISKVVKAV